MISNSRKAQSLIMVTIFMWLLFSLAACSTQTATPPTTSAATTTASVAPASQTIAATTEPASETTPFPDPSAESSGGIVPGSVQDVATSVAERTPVPSATPGRVDTEIKQFVQDAGLEGKTFLGLTAEDWINIGISILIILIGYILGIRLLSGFLRWFVKRTKVKFDDSFVEHIFPDLRWLVVLIFTRFAVLRLEFLSVRLRTALEDLFFALGLLLVTIIAIRLINYATQWYKNNLVSDGDRNRLRPVMMTVNRLSIFVVLILGLSITMSHFGVDIGALSLTLIILVVVVSFGARDYISDVISGFIILADQPFRVHDGVLLTDLDTWGDVLEIGTRTTRIRTKDNREVVIPNTKILDSQITNYTYPNNHYRMQEDIGIAYDSDLDKARQVIKDALLGIDHIMTDKPVDVLFNGFGDTNRQIRVRWWITDYHNEVYVRDQACTVIEKALNEAKIDMPYNTYNINVNMDKEVSDE